MCFLFWHQCENVPGFRQNSCFNCKWRRANTMCYETSRNSDENNMIMVVPLKGIGSSKKQICLNLGSFV